MVGGCHFHPSWQPIAALDVETGEITERRLMNGNGEAERFYQALPVPSLIGIEACGNSQWLIELWQRLGHEVLIGDAAQIQCQLCSETKDRSPRRSAHSEAVGRESISAFVDPQRRAARSAAVADPSTQTGLAPDAGKRWFAAPGVEPRTTKEEQAVEPSRAKGSLRAPACAWAACRREDLLELLANLNQRNGKLDAAVERAAEENSQARLLMTQPGGRADHLPGIRADFGRCLTI